ncbi:MAG: SagB/ThcOx family dehydrogenase [Thermofilum sp.]
MLGESGERVELLLPLPAPRSKVALEEAILLRRSVREWARSPLSLEDLALILWAAQGLAGYDGWPRRTAPSAGATYPLELYAVLGEEGVRVGGSFAEAGVYKYRWMRHSLALVREGDVRRELWAASLRQEWVLEAPVSIVICAVHRRTTRRYGERGERYVYMEAGHAGQNIYLMVAALNLGTVAVGAFDDAAVARVIRAQAEEHPLYIFPVGVPEKPSKGRFEELWKLLTESRKRGKG